MPNWQRLKKDIDVQEMLSLEQTVKKIETLKSELRGLKSGDDAGAVNAALDVHDYYQNLIEDQIKAEAKNSENKIATLADRATKAMRQRFA